MNACFPLSAEYRPARQDGAIATMFRRTLACTLLLSSELCSVYGEDNDGPRKNDTTWTRAVIGGIVLAVLVMIMVVGVLVMAAKEEDGRALTKVLTKAQSSGDGRSAEQDVASQGSQAEPRPASRPASPKATAVQLS